MTKIMTTKIPTIPYGMFHLLLCLALPRPLKSRHTLDEEEAKDVTGKSGRPGPERTRRFKMLRGSELTPRSPPRPVTYLSCSARALRRLQGPSR